MNRLGDGCNRIVTIPLLALEQQVLEVKLCAA
jgi:hypothetical protein